MVKKNKKNLDAFSELASPIRLDIISFLNTKNQKISKLAQKMNTSIQAIQRHVDRLTEAGLVEKNSDGIFSLTTIGKASLEQVPAFHFLATYQEYFKEHSFGDLSPKFIHRIGELQNCKLYGNTMLAWEEAKKIVISCEGFLYAAAIQIPLEFYDLAIPKIQKGTKIKIIYGKNTIVPKGHQKLMKKINWNQFVKDGSVQEKFQDKIDINLVVTEKTGEVVFPSIKTGQPDTNAMFSSDDLQFRGWCLDVFDYLWENAKPFEKASLQER